MKKINSILQEVLKKIEPSKKELEIINNSLEEFLKKFEKRLKILKIDAEVFVGGSFAKNSVIKKDYYDIDIFARFDQKYQDDEISKLTGKLLKGFANVSIIHGSRDYFRIKINPSFFIEVIPVIKVKNPRESKNITDLSYSHVKYIKRKMNPKNFSRNFGAAKSRNKQNFVGSKKLLDEIRLAKAFCYANHCYGAESYINGFSGYALELLILHYGSFLKFIKNMSKIEDKLVIDIEKQYKNKSQVMMDLNSSKLKSPIILIDPTYKQRNALAALSDETLEKFKETCKKFLKNPSLKDFEIKKTDLEKVKKDAKKKKFEFILLEVKTDKQEGDIAGSKLLKFYNHLNKEVEKFFDIKNKGFNYNGKKSARYFFVVKGKGEILHSGPRTNDIDNVKRFKKEHAKVFIKNHKVYAKEKIKFNLKKFIEDWKVKNKKKIREMSIKKLRVV